jgi:hypothetical protein
MKLDVNGRIELRNCNDIGEQNHAIRRETVSDNIT